ncbi:MAG TPA: MarR family transcriptional regulator [Nakamurella sp.]
MTRQPDRGQWPTGRLLSTAARLVEQAWNARLREHGVSHAGMIVLATVSRGPVGQRELARDQHVTEQTIGRTIAHLESTGHVRRSTDPADRRRRTVELTPPGATLLAEISDGGERLTDDVLRAAAVDLPHFRHALEALIQILDPGALHRASGITESGDD